MLEVEHLNAWYGKAQILFDVSLAVGQGQCVALMGHNGAGKSTTLKAVLGLVSRQAGVLRFAGRDLATLMPYELSRSGLGWVPEDRRIFSDLSVQENLAVGRQPAREGVPRWTEERVFNLFPHLATLARRLGGQLSGGEQQMLTLARTLMGNPRLLLLDEPSEGMAPVVLEQLAAVLLTLKREGVAILLAEQNLGFARGLADRVVVLEQGRVGYAASMSHLLIDAEAQSRYFLGI